MRRYCGKTICINWQKLKSAICRLLKHKCMPLVKSLTVNASKPLFQNLLSSLSVISGYCSQNLPLRVASKSFSSLSIRAFVRVLTFYYCVSSAVMLSIHCQSRRMAWASGGRRIRHCLNESNSKRLKRSTKIFAAVPIKKGNVAADATAKNQKQISLITHHLIRTVQNKVKPTLVLIKVGMIRQW